MYYQALCSIDAAVLGTTVQVVDRYYQKGVSGSFRQGSVSPFKPFPEQLDLPNLVLDPNANFTDIVCHNYHGFWGITLSSKAMSLFDSFNLDYQGKFAVEIKREEEVREYFTLYFLDLKYEYLDWTKCEFVIWNVRESKKVKLIKFHDYDHYASFLRLQAEEKMGVGLRNKHIAWITGVKDDMFALSAPFNGRYVSEDLYRAIQESNLTGFNFWATDSMNVAWEQQLIIS